MNQFHVIVLAISLLIGCNSRQSHPNPRVFLSDANTLRELKIRVNESDTTLAPAINRLVRLADKAMEFEPVSVMDKPFTPSSGDKHDYMSMGPYWWPDPEKPDGLPYIRRDGEVNPERDEYDRLPLANLYQAVGLLAQAYYFTEEEKYAEHADLLLSTWFFDDLTRMNANMNFGQAIPGRTEGRGIGIIDARSLFRINEAVGLLEGSLAWTTADQAQLVSWMSDFLDWLITSRHGRDEAATKNNHGTWYDVTTAEIAMFVGRDDVALDILKQVPERRIATQIESDGSQPHELARTRSMSYSLMNIEGMLLLALLGDHYSLDIWSYTSPKGANLKLAIEYILPAALEGGDWPYTQISPWTIETSNYLLKLLRIASTKYGELDYPATAPRLDEVDVESNLINLLYPRMN